MALKDNKQFWALIYIGWILGCFSNLVSFIYFGENALWGLSILGIFALILWFLQKVKQDALKPKTSVADNEPKTLSSRLRIWRKGV